MNESILKMEHVRKRFGARDVLTDVNLTVCRGECVCLTGRNGCGKSTLLRVAAGLARPSAGHVQRYSDRVQMVPDRFPPLPISGAALLRGLRGADKPPHGDETETLGLQEYLGQSVQTYSRGMLSKIGALQALDAEADLLLLDEPISGQDETSRRAFLRLVRCRMDAGCAVLMACHERELIDALATRQYVLSQGTLAECVGREECLCEKCGRYIGGECPGRCEHA